MPRTVGEWTKDELKVLADYLPYYFSTTSNAIDRIYVDGFAGPGTNIVSKTREVIDGSPLIALKAHASNGKRFTKLFFIEQNRRALDELRAHLKIQDTDGRAEIVEGDVDVKHRGLHELASLQLERTQRNSGGSGNSTSAKQRTWR